MDVDHEAISRITRLRSCSKGEALSFCERVLNHPQAEKATASDIADALFYITEKGLHSSVRGVAKYAEKVATGQVVVDRKDASSIERSGEDAFYEVDEDEEFKRFEGCGDHQAFIDWIDEKGANGFVLNLKNEEEVPILHSACCSHLKPNPNSGNKATVHPKVCSTNRQALKNKARRLSGGTVEYCSYCDV